MSSSIRASAFFIVVTLLGGCTIAHESATLPDKIEPEQGMLLLVVDSNVSFQRLKFKQLHDVFETVAAMDISPGRTVRFISVPPGTYYWSRMEYPTQFNYAHFVDFSHGDTDLVFTVKAGTVSYPGDLLIRQDGNNDNYRVRLLDHAAMLLSDINQQQKDFISKYGLTYTGKETDKFFDYYYGLQAPAKPEAPTPKRSQP